MNKTPIPQHLREQVFKRDNYTCQYCGKANLKSPHADHVYPESKGGETSLNNLVTACQRCNSKKHNKIGMWPRKILRVTDTKKIVRTKTVEIHNQPYKGRILLLGSFSVFIGGVIYGGMTLTNIWIGAIPSGILFVLSFIFLFLGK